MESNNNKPIYLDYAATTPCDPRVLEVMLPYFNNIYGNINSLHYYGAEALEALTNARQQIANDINVNADEIIFTSGATESSNIAILRTIEKLKQPFFTAKTQHTSIINIANRLQSLKQPVHFLKVNNDGLLNLNYLEEQLKEHNGLVSVCLVNNETGVLQNIEQIIEICHKYNSLVHVDATQAYGKIHLDVKKLDFDFMSASGHKIYGPKGIGVLYCKRDKQKYIRVPRANPDIEFGIRAGTIPVPLCVGFAEASKISHSCIDEELVRISKLRQIFIDKIQNNLEEIYINGSKTSNYPGIINVSFRGCEGESLMMESKRIAISSGSACTSNKLTISHVLDAMGIAPDIAQSSLRIAIGRHTTEEDINIAVEDLTNATLKLRSISAVWDMIKAGIDINKRFERGIYKHD